MTVIHISFDYPDKIDDRKTKAVSNLVNSQKGSDYIVFSLNRVALRFSNLKPEGEPHGYTLYIYGLPYGILLFLWMFIAYRRIAKIIIKDNIRPELFHAHKLTYEGIIAFLLSKKFNVPYILTIRGDSDLKLLYYKRLLRRYYARIVSDAKAIIFLAPWVVKPLKKYFGEVDITGKGIILPNIVPHVKCKISDHQQIKRFITVFHFKSYRRKNIKRIIQAFDQALLKYPGYVLDIVGGGPNRDKIVSFINRSKFPEHYYLSGEMENEVLAEILPNYEGFILPSFPETFGMVFIEALAAGIPVIYSRNSGIDGYFDDLNIGIGVDHKSVEEIAMAIGKLIESNPEYKKNIRNHLSAGILDKFSNTDVGSNYARIIEEFSVKTDESKT